MRNRHPKVVLQLLCYSLGVTSMPILKVKQQDQIEGF
jgi:hypothetical protein